MHGFLLKSVAESLLIDSSTCLRNEMETAGITPPPSLLLETELLDDAGVLTLVVLL
ncbi:MAG: hypothetical protein JWM39_137 [Parcubacteria group bacterium]|nr:hypothetical protein [Parcubacteria group bacterium]